MRHGVFIIRLGIVLILVLSYDIETHETGNIDEDERDELESTEIILDSVLHTEGNWYCVPFSQEYMRNYH